MSICRARFCNTSNALMLWMSDEQIRLQVPPKLFGVHSWIAQMIRQWIPDCWSRVSLEGVIAKAILSVCLSHWWSTLKWSKLSKYVSTIWQCDISNSFLTPNFVAHMIGHNCDTQQHENILVIFPSILQLHILHFTTCLRCGWKYYVGFIANLVQFPAVKEF